MIFVRQPKVTNLKKKTRHQACSWAWNPYLQRPETTDLCLCSAHHIYPDFAGWYKSLQTADTHRSSQRRPSVAAPHQGLRAVTTTLDTTVRHLQHILPANITTAPCLQIYPFPTEGSWPKVLLPVEEELVNAENMVWGQSALQSISHQRSLQPALNMLLLTHITCTQPLMED